MLRRDNSESDAMVFFFTLPGRGRHFLFDFPLHFLIVIWLIFPNARKHFFLGMNDKKSLSLPNANQPKLLA